MLKYILGLLGFHTTVYKVPYRKWNVFHLTWVHFPIHFTSSLPVKIQVLCKQLLHCTIQGTVTRTNVYVQYTRFCLISEYVQSAFG